MRLIDVHQHVFWHGRDDRGLIADMDAHGIAQAWLLTWEEPLEETGYNYARVLDPRYKVLGDASGHSVASNRAVPVPDRFIPGYCPHPRSPGCGQTGGGH